MKKVIILIAAGFIFGFVAGSPNIFNAGSPLSVARGMLSLSFSQDKIVQISSSPERYISKIHDGNAPLVELMSEAGWQFAENTGLADGYGPVFTREGDRKGIKAIQYTRQYRVWEVLY